MKRYTIYIPDYVAKYYENIACLVHNAPEFIMEKSLLYVPDHMCLAVGEKKHKKTDE